MKNVCAVVSEMVFKEFDHDSKGKISISSALKALQLLDQAPTEKEIREVLKKQGTEGSK